MVLRALFWISLVAILMPHEPDLGLGRPGSYRIGDCRSACSDAFTHFQAIAVRSLAQVKEDIARERHRIRED